MSIQHPLYNWLITNNRDFTEFAGLIGLKSEKSLYRYFSEARTPRKKTLNKIQEATKGQITPNDFFGDAQ